MSAPMSNSGFQAAMSILSHVYFAPILGRLIRAKVPDLLDGGAVHSAELASQAGLHPLSTPFGAFYSIDRMSCPTRTTCSRNEVCENGASWSEEVFLSRSKSRETSGFSARFCTTGRMPSAGGYCRDAGNR